uniref:Nudix hydrolase domain-containing protein n=1 Tax=Tetraselmis sp. GSL018 TaxID=582737 RepID=A0A061RT60_9CHLO
MKSPEVVSEEQVYERYITVYNRRVSYPSQLKKERIFEFDVVGHPKANFLFTCIFPISFNCDKPQVTVLREYCWGTDQMLYTLPTGGFDPSKHSCFEECARSELSEEAHLQGGRLVRLLPDDHPGIAESKWCANRFIPFLVIDPEADTDPGPREDEELIEVHRLTLDELDEHLHSGYFCQPAFTTSALAIRELRSMGRL